MLLRIGRLLLIAIGVEVLTVLSLVVLVALVGPPDPGAAQEYAAQQGRWVGPVAGFVYCVVAGWLVARSAVTRHTLQGMTLGATVAVIDSLLLFASGSNFELIFVISNVGRLLAGAIGGRLAGRASTLPSNSI